MYWESIIHMRRRREGGTHTHTYTDNQHARANKRITDSQMHTVIPKCKDICITCHTWYRVLIVASRKPRNCFYHTRPISFKRLLHAPEAATFIYWFELFRQWRGDYGSRFHWCQTVIWLRHAIEATICNNSFVLCLCSICVRVHHRLKQQSSCLPGQHIQSMCTGLRCRPPVGVERQMNVVRRSLRAASYVFQLPSLRVLGVPEFRSTKKSSNSG